MCGRLLVVRIPRDKKSRWLYQCTEIAADLHSCTNYDHNQPFYRFSGTPSEKFIALIASIVLSNRNGLRCLLNTKTTLTTADVIESLPLHVPRSFFKQPLHPTGLAKVSYSQWEASLLS